MSLSSAVWKVGPGEKAERSCAVGGGQGPQSWEKSWCWCLGSGLTEQAHLARLPQHDKSLTSFYERERVGPSLLLGVFTHLLNLHWNVHTDGGSKKKATTDPMGSITVEEFSLSQVNKLHFQGDCWTGGIWIPRWFTHMLSHSSNACLTCL